MIPESIMQVNRSLKQREGIHQCDYCWLAETGKTEFLELGLNQTELSLTSYNHSLLVNE